MSTGLTPCAWRSRSYGGWTLSCPSRGTVTVRPCLHRPHQWSGWGRHQWMTQMKGSVFHVVLWYMKILPGFSCLLDLLTFSGSDQTRKPFRMDKSFKTDSVLTWSKWVENFDVEAVHVQRKFVPDCSQMYKTSASSPLTNNEAHEPEAWGCYTHFVCMCESLRVSAHMPLWK